MYAYIGVFWLAFGFVLYDLSSKSTSYFYIAGHTMEVQYKVQLYKCTLSVNCILCIAYRYVGLAS